jgi:hypothetical protein
MGKPLRPLTLRDYNQDSLERRIKELEDRPDQNWFVVKRFNVFEHDYRVYCAVVKQGDDTFVR